ncbi:succinate dehydrogenase/fumarate reductase, flavoprotein subunit, partial [mine drainage metagenome]
FIKKKLPAMYEQYKEFAGVDITKEKMEVAPTVHYFMGGIEVEAETCRTNVPGLYSCGEAAGGLHGANRLGGNSLADILVFGRRAGSDSAQYSKGRELEHVSKQDIEAEISRMDSYLKDGAENPYPLIEELRATMSDKVGIIRNEKELKDALDSIRSLKERSKAIGVSGGIKFNKGFMACFELDNMLTLAECMVMSAIMRKESRGAHTRSDYPKKDSAYKLNILCKLQNGSVILDTKPIPEMPDHLRKIVKEEVY